MRFSIFPYLSLQVLAFSVFQITPVALSKKAKSTPKVRQKSGKKLCRKRVNANKNIRKHDFFSQLTKN